MVNYLDGISELGIEAGLMESVFSVDSHSVEVRNLTLNHPMYTSFGTIDSRPSAWVSANVDVNGSLILGRGEGATLPLPLFTDDAAGNIGANTFSLLEAIKRTDSITLFEACDVIRSFKFPDGGKYPTARLAVEMTLIDAITRSTGFSVAEAIGVPKEIETVPYGKSIGGVNTDDILREANNALVDNARKIKIKITPEIFDEVVGAIMELKNVHGGDVELMVDANGGFDSQNKDHLQMLEALDTLDLLMIEEPVSRRGPKRGLEAVSILRQTLNTLRTPICLDDCLVTSDDCEKALDLGLAEVINVKPGRVGSFIGSLGMVQRAKSLNAQVMVGGMLEATPGRCMTTTLGAYCLKQGFKIPGDLSLAQDRLKDDLVNSEQFLEIANNGEIGLPKGLGWGFA